MSKTTPSLVDSDGRTWMWDARAKVWYAPDDGLEIATREEIEQFYGPLDN